MPRPLRLEPLPSALSPFPGRQRRRLVGPATRAAHSMPPNPAFPRAGQICQFQDRPVDRESLLSTQQETVSSGHFQVDRKRRKGGRAEAPSMRSSISSLRLPISRPNEPCRTCCTKQSCSPLASCLSSPAGLANRLKPTRLRSRSSMSCRLRFRDLCRVSSRTSCWASCPSLQLDPNEKSGQRSPRFLLGSLHLDQSIMSFTLRVKCSCSAVFDVPSLRIPKLALVHSCQTGVSAQCLPEPSGGVNPDSRSQCLPALSRLRLAMTVRTLGPRRCRGTSLRRPRSQTTLARCIVIYPSEWSRPPRLRSLTHRPRAARLCREQGRWPARAGRRKGTPRPCQWRRAGRRVLRGGSRPRRGSEDCGGEGVKVFSTHVCFGSDNSKRYDTFIHEDLDFPFLFGGTRGVYKSPCIIRRHVRHCTCLTSCILYWTVITTPVWE
jgi:hypothetical protein